MKLFHLKSVCRLLTLLLLAIIFRGELNAENKSQPIIQYIKPLSAICIKAVDGDTIIVNIAGVKERVRLIGVDTPETKHPRKPVQRFGKEAYNFTWRMVEGKKVRLEFDQNQRDKYRRLLAYVYLEDGTFLNAEIIKQGYGHAYTRFPFRHMQKFRNYEREARIRKRGLWKYYEYEKK